MANILLIYSWLKFSAISFFTVRVVVCTQISNIDVLDTKDKIPLACIDVSWVGRCFILQAKH